jgi:hypothetical protein
MRIKGQNIHLHFSSYLFWLRLSTANANYSFLGLINEFAVNPTKDLNEAVGGALT